MGTFIDMILHAWKIAVTRKPLFHQGRDLFKNKIARLDFEKSAVCIGFVVMPQKPSRTKFGKAFTFSLFTIPFSLFTKSVREGFWKVRSYSEE